MDKGSVARTIKEGNREKMLKNSSEGKLPGLSVSQISKIGSQNKTSSAISLKQKQKLTVGGNSGELDTERIKKLLDYLVIQTQKN